MASFEEYMSVGLTKCGTDKQTFAELVDLWNRNKDLIQQMDKDDVRESLTCPDQQ